MHSQQNIKIAVFIVTASRASVAHSVETYNLSPMFMKLGFNLF